MKKTIILLLSAFILAGCGSKTEVPANGGTESSSQAVSEAEKSEENEVLTIWRKDITLQDAFIPTQELKDLPFKELTTSAAEALPVHIKLNSEEKKSEKIGSGLL